MRRPNASTWAGLCALAVLAAACSPRTAGVRLMDSARTPDGVFFVEHQPNDGRHLDTQIAESLQAHGVTVTTDREQANYVVTYEDRWMWDMRMYLRDMDITVRDAKTGAMVGSGRSHQDSLAALGKTHRDIIDLAVSALFEGK